MNENTPSVKDLSPIFTGTTWEGEEITLYQRVNRPEEIYILLPNDELWALGPGVEISTLMSPDRNEMRVDIAFAAFRNNRWDLLKADSR